METDGNKKVAKSCNIFYCKKCDYNTIRKSSFDKHLSTLKHRFSKDGNICATFGNKKSCTNISLSCEYCLKEFKNRSGLWKHNNVCLIKNNTSIIQSEKKIDGQKNDIYEVVKMLIKENNDLKTFMVEQTNKILEHGITNITNNTNSNNKTFNLHVFLNETCKNAMNINEFIDSINLELLDLERIGELGYVEGISNIISNNLRAIDINLRPVHCTDKKREIIYIKDENKWEKEDENKSKLRKAIKRIANKNIKLLPQFKEKNPDYNNSSSKMSDKYEKIVIEAMGGLGNNDLEKEDKIIKNISKNILIEK